MSRRHRTPEPDAVADFEQQTRPRGGLFGPPRWDSRGGQLLSPRQSRAAFLFLVSLLIGGAIVSAIIRVRGGKPPDWLLALTGAAFLAVALLLFLDFIAKRALHEIHRRRWPGE